MNGPQTTPDAVQDRWLLLLGGVAGILGTVFLFTFFQVGPPLPGFCTVPMDQCLQTVADNRTAALVGGYFGVGSALLMIVFLVMLYRSARGTGSGIAHVGAVLGILGFFVLGLLIATSVSSGTNLAMLYSNASPANKSTIVAIAKAVSGVTPGGLFGMDTFLRALGVAALGAAMMRSANFGRRYGGLTVLVGLVYIPLDVGGILFDPLFIVANLVFFVWLAVLGGKLISLSRKP